MEGVAKRTVRQKISYSVKLNFIFSVCIGGKEHWWFVRRKMEALEGVGVIK